MKKPKKIEVPSFSTNASFNDTPAKKKLSIGILKGDLKELNKLAIQEFQKAYEAWKIDFEEWQKNGRGEAPVPPKPKNQSELVRLAVRLGTDLLKHLSENEIPFPTNQRS
tara:strand:+ start:3646 stop:3975 length:330 start_codon:yes stop_codon:yes gene_type:complete